MKRAISGIRPSGRLHLGNYIGSILPALKYNADVLIASYHAPEGNPIELYHQLRYFFPDEKIKLQSCVFDAKLFFKLMNVSSDSLLRNMPQYRTKEKTALMYAYPVLMAQDIADYDLVIVGDDQKPHIEFANDILHRVGAKCPKAIYEGGRVMDLRHPDQKMSKSNPNSCLFLDDDEAVVRRKVGRAVTDENGVNNLIFIYKSLGGKDKFTRNDELKEAIIELILDHLRRMYHGQPIKSGRI